MDGDRRPRAISNALRTWMAGRTYPELFADVFGSNEIAPARMAIAMASCERKLNSTQPPIDQQFAGQQGPAALEQQGQCVFVAYEEARGRGAYNNIGIAAITRQNRAKTGRSKAGSCLTD